MRADDPLRIVRARAASYHETQPNHGDAGKEAMGTQDITIGTLARRAGVNVETVRYYQRRGLLREPDKPLGGIRRYGNDDLARIKFVKRAQQMGFSLEEIAALFKLEDGTHCAEARAIAAEKLEDIRRRLEGLREMEQRLRQLVSECDAGGDKVRCPLIDSLRDQ